MSQFNYAVIERDIDGVGRIVAETELFCDAVAIIQNLENHNFDKLYRIEKYEAKDS